MSMQLAKTVKNTNGITLLNKSSQSYRVSLVIWDHTANTSENTPP